MLLWEAVSTKTNGAKKNGSVRAFPLRQTKRLKFDVRCAATTKSGKRCKGRIRRGSEYCTFHNPALSAEQRRGNAAKGGRSRCALSHLPDGYLRNLTNRTAVGQAMDRLYREIRLGIMTPEMGAVLFDILCRILDSRLYGRNGAQPPKRRSKADRIRPKVSDLLTRTEKSAWRRAVANSSTIVAEDPDPKFCPGQSDDRRQPIESDRPEAPAVGLSLALPAPS